MSHSLEKSPAWLEVGSPITALYPIERKSPQDGRRFRGSGNPVSCLESRWVPAFAGATSKFAKVSAMSIRPMGAENRRR